MKKTSLFAILVLLAPLSDLSAQETPASAAKITTLFDGTSLKGWDIQKGEEKWWKLQDGVLTAGSLTEMVPYNSFISTTKRYANFELRLKIRLSKEGAGEGFMNSGVQLRSVRVKDSSEMSGYQVDAGIKYWGTLYDESRRNKQLAGPVNEAEVAKAAKDWEWNDFKIRCEGPRIRSWINGVAAVDYLETDPKVPLEGLIGLQIHAGGKAIAQFKDIQIRELPATPGAPKWDAAPAAK